jgi:hypothetical protein
MKKSSSSSGQKRPSASAPAAKGGGKVAAAAAGGAGAAASISHAHLDTRGSSAAAVRGHTDDLSSDDESPRNTVGNVPSEWYADRDHIGYDRSGKRIMRKRARDGMETFLKSQDDPLHRWTVYDEENDEEMVLSRRDVALLKNLSAGTYAHPEFDETSDAYNLTDVYSRELEIHPLNNADEPKRRFIPSKWEVRRARGREEETASIIRLG